MTRNQARAKMARNAAAIDKARARVDALMHARNHLWADARAAGVLTDEIAKAYGVTHGAVSRVTNGRPHGEAAA